MTEMLQGAFEMASRLPALEQDALAAQLIEEIESEARWDAAFARSQDVLVRMAEAAMAEHRAGRTLPLVCDPE